MDIYMYIFTDICGLHLKLRISFKPTFGAEVVINEQRCGYAEEVINCVKKKNEVDKPL